MGTVGRKMPCGAGFNALPEECIANIFSLTTPLDACRLSLVSSIFRSAAESDDVWGRFLPPDYGSIISQSDVSSPSVTPLKKKQLFFRLCDTPLLIDGSNKRFSFDKWSGKICYMIAARELTIIWGDTHHSWSWKSLLQSRFAEVAELRDVCWLEIRGKINTGMLSPETAYTAYLVCKFTNAHGFYGTDDLVGIVGGENFTRTLWISGEKRWRHQVSQPSRPRERIGHYVKERGDGWLEIELGEYFNEGEADEELEMSLRDVKNTKWKRGLIIQGIEIRPKESNKIKK